MGRSERIVLRIAREPTVHFALLAAILFGMAAFFGGSERETVEISAAELEIRILRAQAARGAPLTSEERDAVLEEMVVERILVREARAMGLEEDARIHDILVQKMLHVLSGDVIQPTEDELRAFYRENRQLYAPPVRVTAEEWVLPEGEPPGRTPGRFTTLARISRDELTGLFGPATAETVMSADPGLWVGPHETARGWHWFRITERHPSGPPPFEQIREPLRLDWIRREEEARLEERVDELRRGYEVEFVEVGEGG